MKLVYAIVFTPSMEKMTGFYRDGLGLEVESESPFFAEFHTGPTSLGLLAIHPDQKPEYELCFAVEQVENEIERLRSRGMEFVDELRTQPFGKLIHMRDPEGNVVTLLQPERPSAGTGEPPLASVIVNTWDFGASTNFYRDRLGLQVLREDPHWIEFDTGGAQLAVHARAERPDIPAHGRQKVAHTFHVDDLEAYMAVLDEFGTEPVTPPTDASFGTYAEVIDPDGNLVVFRQPPSVVPVPEAAAETFEDDSDPHQAGMRKPVKKRSKAVSRVVLKPEYQEKASQRRAKKKLATSHVPSDNGGSQKLRVVAERGVGPERTRMEPKSPSRDPKRAKAKPAIGRRKKAEARTFESKKKSVAGDSKQKPVKRAVAKQPVKRTAAKRGGR